MKLPVSAAIGCIASLMLASAASAQDRFNDDSSRFQHGMYAPEINSYDLTCAEARGLVRSRGSVVMDIGPHRYGRFVNSERFCARGMRAVPAWVPTADRRQCSVGYRCRLDAQR